MKNLMKNIDEDYLWDKTGEPDPEIQQLEQVLGTLRYQPRPLDIPAGLAPGHKRAFVQRFLAIAATLAIILLGVGLWSSLQRQTIEAPKVVKFGNPAKTNVAIETAGVAPNKDSSPTAPLPDIDPDDKPFRDPNNRRVLANELAQSRRLTQNTPELSAIEREEAEAASEQLMLALRVASSKLNFAQKKAQEINSDNLIHNQHKIG